MEKLVSIFSCTQEAYTAILDTPQRCNALPLDIKLKVLMLSFFAGIGMSILGFYIKDPHWLGPTFISFGVFGSESSLAMICYLKYFSPPDERLS